MTTTAIIRAIRQPLIWLVIAAFAALALLALESTGSSSGPSLVRLDKTAKTSVQPHSSGGALTDNPGGQPTRHCTDGNGQDDVMNPHCLSDG